MAADEGKEWQQLRCRQEWSCRGSDCDYDSKSTTRCASDNLDADDCACRRCKGHCAQGWDAFCREIVKADTCRRLSVWLPPGGLCVSCLLEDVVPQQAAVRLPEASPYAIQRPRRMQLGWRKLFECSWLREASPFAIQRLQEALPNAVGCRKPW